MLSEKFCGQNFKLVSLSFLLRWNTGCTCKTIRGIKFTRRDTFGDLFAGEAVIEIDIFLIFVLTCCDVDDVTCYK